MTISQDFLSPNPPSILQTHKFNFFKICIRVLIYFDQNFKFIVAIAH